MASLATADIPVRSAEDAYRLFRPAMAISTRELIQIAHLDRDRRLLELTTCDGEPSSVDLPMGRILRRALMLGASGLMIAHNHPSGDPTPSAADIAVTRRLVEVARDLDLQVYDHLVIAGDTWRSFFALGLL